MPLLLLAVCGQQPQASQSGGTDPAAAARQTATSFVDPVLLERANGRLARISRTLPRDVSLSQLLTLVLPPEDAPDPATRPDEHRASLVALAFYVNQWPIEVLVPEAGTWPRATSRRVTLGGRRDQAQHFIVSAAMSAAAGSALADAVALYKEIRDGQRGSGFSFSDVAANRAGQRFGALASGSTSSAEALARRLRSPLTDGDIMPSTTGLPGNLNDVEFKQRYGSTGSAAYSQVIEDIDSRVDALALYR